MITLWPGILGELPPRARRIPFLAHDAATWHGTTSACAENTRPAPTRQTQIRNYLRVRGEYFKVETNIAVTSELPPRARRIQAEYVKALRSGGTTSACAENTATHHTNRDPARNYLRVRGEYTRRGF